MDFFCISRHTPLPLEPSPQRASPTPRTCPSPSLTGTTPPASPPPPPWNPQCWPALGVRFGRRSTTPAPGWRMSGWSDRTWCVRPTLWPVPCLPSLRNSTQVGSELNAGKIELIYRLFYQRFVFSSLVKEFSSYG